MTTIRVEVTGELKRATMTLKALATEIAGPGGMGRREARPLSAGSLFILVQFRTPAQARRFHRALERFVPATLARVEATGME